MLTAAKIDDLHIANAALKRQLAELHAGVAATRGGPAFHPFAGPGPERTASAAAEPAVQDYTLLVS
ncbi:hypothetical protein [Novosphingobium lentum]|uniref:hypothetical protein n=1 Tax=Novosphingobium lentum TaxID=145287 RepID=UPI00082C344D|nr:hypothetical protein [Novosphingobium lentum]